MQVCRCCYSRAYGITEGTTVKGSIIDPAAAANLSGLLWIQHDINFGSSELKKKTYRRHKITVCICIDGSCIGSCCAIEAPIGGRNLHKPSTVKWQCIRLTKIIYLERSNSIHIMNELQVAKVVKHRRRSISSSGQECCMNTLGINICSIDRQFTIHRPNPEIRGLH